MTTYEPVLLFTKVLLYGDIYLTSGLHQPIRALALRLTQVPNGVTNCAGQEKLIPILTGADLIVRWGDQSALLLRLRPPNARNNSLTTMSVKFSNW